MTLNLTNDEALILFNALSDNERIEKLLDDAEQHVFWMIEGQLERDLEAIIAPNYNELLTRAKEKVVDEFGKIEKE